LEYIDSDKEIEPFTKINFCVIFYSMSAIFSTKNTQNATKFTFGLLTFLAIVVAISSVHSTVLASKPSQATAVNLISDFRISGKSYTSQGSGEIVGENLYTTAHNYTLDQIEFLINNGAKFISIKGECTRVVVNNRIRYNEGALQIPLKILNTVEALDFGLSYPTVLQNNPNVGFINWYSDVLNPEYIYTKGIVKNQNGKKEQFLTGNNMFTANGTGLSGASYKYNSDLTTIDNQSKASYLLGIHVGAANYQGQKINIMWVSNGDGTFSYARYLQNGNVIRVDNLLERECNL
jgi:hypothetical protein